MSDNEASRELEMTSVTEEPTAASEDEKPPAEDEICTNNKVQLLAADEDSLSKCSPKDVDINAAHEVIPLQIPIDSVTKEAESNSDETSFLLKETLKSPATIEESELIGDIVESPSERSTIEKSLKDDEINENRVNTIKSSVPDSSNKTSIISTTNDQNVTENPSIESASEVSQQSAHKANENPKETETTQSSDEYAEHVTYTDDGIAIYTDPKTQYKYKWCEIKSNWDPFKDETNPSTGNDEESNPYENEHYRWCTETNQWIPKTTAPISSQTETEHYRWDAEKNEWILKTQEGSLENDVTYGYEDGVRTYTDKDGAVFFWDTEKKAWFPKIDDDFMARYQMSYGFIDNTTVTAAVEEGEMEEPSNELKNVDVPAGGVKRKAPPEPPKWFEMDPSQNTKVYVSNLPVDVTMEEFAEIMSKYGMIMRDPQTQKQKLKLYTEKDGQIKGDGLCDYIKVESVDLALKLLDESLIRGNKIKVQRAKFQMKGEYNPTLKPKRKKKDKEKLQKMKEKLFDWRPEKMRGERSKHEKMVIIKNLFTPELFDKEVHLIIDYQNDLREECSKCGTVRKVVIFDRHVDGVAQINMADPDQADLVVQMMNGRYFGQRKLIAEIWDGKTKYKVAETEKEVQERINKWDKYLETVEEKTTQVESDATAENVKKTLPA